ncbi:hypothetical protein ACFE04_028142 [Oxalis oulophora]
MESSSAVTTVSEREQWTIESRVFQIYNLFASIPPTSQSLIRPWVCYWILHSIALLGDYVDDDLENRTILFLSRCQDRNGGYGGGPGQLPHLATTYDAVNTLITLGGDKALSSINRWSVGDDEFGHMLADILKQNKVDYSGVRFDKHARTALAFVTLRADGEREFMFYRNPSADMLLRDSELDANLIKKAAIFHYGSISLIDEPCRSAHLAAMDIAKKSGCILSYDPNLRLPLWPSADAARKGIMSIWNEADIIKISEEEIEFLTGGEDPYNDNVVLKNLYHPKLKLLLVTEGPAGCRYYTKRHVDKPRPVNMLVHPTWTSPTLPS